jgi:hypothetical protein
MPQRVCAAAYAVLPSAGIEVTVAWISHFVSHTTSDRRLEIHDSDLSRSHSITTLSILSIQQGFPYSVASQWRLHVPQEKASARSVAAYDKVSQSFQRKLAGVFTKLANFIHR